VLPVVSKSAEEFAEYIAAETGRWAQIAKETGARLDSHRSPGAERDQRFQGESRAQEKWL